MFMKWIFNCYLSFWYHGNYTKFILQENRIMRVSYDNNWLCVKEGTNSIVFGLIELEPTIIGNATAFHLYIDTM